MTSTSFAEFVNEQLADAELAALDADLVERLAAAYAHTALLAAWAADEPQLVAELDPEMRAEALAQLNHNITQLETLRG